MFRLIISQCFAYTVSSRKFYYTPTVFISIAPSSDFITFHINWAVGKLLSILVSMKIISKNKILMITLGSVILFLKLLIVR